MSNDEYQHQQYFGKEQSTVIPPASSGLIALDSTTKSSPIEPGAVHSNGD
ncbi:MAG: hypothetical protein K0R26_1187 [Bacteroidota bacterium]|jgi:hypothetical protein|nr:hypothetical protein [Bacteroidota bacterium]